MVTHCLDLDQDTLASFFLRLLWGLVPVLERELQMNSGAEGGLKFLVEPSLPPVQAGFPVCGACPHSGLTQGSACMLSSSPSLGFPPKQCCPDRLHKS